MRALIIDDQPLIVSGLQAVMASLQTPVETSCAESADAARRLLASDMHFDFVLLDLDLAGSGGLNFFSELRRTYPAMSIVVLLESNSNELVSRLVVMGATGFVGCGSGPSSRAARWRRLRLAAVSRSRSGCP